MVFSSVIFLVYFLPVFLLIYVLFPRAFKNWWILIASIAFYTWGAPQFVFILMGSTVLDFFIVRHLHAAETRKRKRLFLILSLSMNLGLLAYFKYANFFVENVNALLHSIGFEKVGWTEVALPIGISFYTFQTLTYAIDVYRGTHAPLKKLHNYLLYIMSFPQMIAGPIVRFNLIADQITSRNETIDDRIFGFYRFCIGLAKKVLIANVLGEVATEIMSPEHELSFTSSWIGILAYTMQIYFDFAGYSDMAIGLGKIMGFTFPENFNNPYNSRSITEFWRRWHMTLGQWMRDYLYIPLGGSKVNSKGRLYFNLGFVFLVSGLWHGASWNFVIWGAFHGLFLILDRLFLKKILDTIGVIPSVVITFLVVVIGWVFFAIEDLDVSLDYLGVMFNPNSMANTYVLSNEVILTSIFALLFSFAVLTKPGKLIQEFIYTEKRIKVRNQLGRLFIGFVFFIVCLSYVTASGFNPFIYFRF